MKKFKSPGKAQRFLSAHNPINNLFRPRRHLLKATAYRAARKQAFSTWLEQSITRSRRDPALLLSRFYADSQTRNRHVEQLDDAV